MIIFTILGTIIILIILFDAFETIILTRRVTRRLRFARIFYRSLWKLWRKGKKLFKSGEPAKDYLGFFGPISLILLIIIWAVALIFGFALINFGLQTKIQSPYGIRDFMIYLYLSGGTFFPTGLSDTYPLQIQGKFLAIIESGIGFGFLAMVIGYLPVLYQAFSKREVNINLLDSRAGSPPSALFFLQQVSKGNITEELKSQLVEWEKWCAELLETHISYPVLAYYRSQHDDQSWISALLMILDVSAIVLISEHSKSLHTYAKSTFAIARHAAVDLSQVFTQIPKPPNHDRLSQKDLAVLRKLLKNSGFVLKEGPRAEEKLKYLRGLYEPYILPLSNFFLMPISPIVLGEEMQEAWKRNI